MPATSPTSTPPASAAGLPLATPTDDGLEALAATALAAAGGVLTGLESLGGGRNSRVYRLTDIAGTRTVLKVYHRDPRDPRDRLATELAALDFMERHGIRAIPRALAWDRARGYLLMEHVDGCPARELPVDDRRVAEAVSFLRELHVLAGVRDASALPPASEACFSLTALAAHVRARLSRLLAAPDADAGDPAERFLVSDMRALVRGELLPAFARFATRGAALLADAELDPAAELPRADRTLSPSDFGFHNALARPDGPLTFVDFEYFGWDDPVKTTSDILLHPGMALAPTTRAAFVHGLLATFGDRPAFVPRLRASYPLFGLKWAAILLNEFLPEHRARRRFATTTPSAAASGHALLDRQLAKARALFTALREDADAFIDGLVSA